MATREAKRKRVYTVEPKKIVESIFARNYLSYLVPALMKIKEESSGKDSNSQCDISKDVKYEVDMAMVLSTQGFAWSNGLKVKLQRDDDVNASTSIKNTFENEDEEDKLMSLKKLIPGGEKMCDEEVGSELESYIRCLQMQVNVLQCLLQTS